MRERKCKASGQLSSYIDGHLDGEQIRVMAAHVKTCSECESDVRHLQSLQSSLRALETPSTPPNTEFWANAYREARLKVPVPTSRWTFNGWNYIASKKGFSAAPVLSLALILFVPIASNQYRSSEILGVAGQTSLLTAVDVAPLICAHTSYSAVQPLTDDSRISMVLSDEAAAREDGTADDQTNVTNP